MPFVQRTKMDERRRLCWMVLEEGMSIARASSLAGVSRQTGSLWVNRAREAGIAGIEEGSRRPHASPNAAPSSVSERLMDAAAEFPDWGPKKLLHVAYPKDPPVCERTAARILARAGRRIHPPVEPAAPGRFERASSNELWQMDFKLVGPRRARGQVLTILDDASRFLLALDRVPDLAFPSVKQRLWDSFGCHGLPLEILTDNGPAFRCSGTWRWSGLDLWLMLLGVRSSHGRPRHPQTQGKVERLHGTIERERVRLEELEEFRARYNWIRPHEAIHMKTPGSLYVPSERRRPDQEPEPWFSSGAAIRKTDSLGKFTYKGRLYRAGISLGRQAVGIIELEEPFLEWAGSPLCPIRELLIG